MELLRHTAVLPGVSRQCGVVWCGVVWCGVVWCGVVWCGVVWCGVVWCGVVWCGVVWCGILGAPPLLRRDRLVKSVTPSPSVLACRHCAHVSLSFIYNMLLANEKALQRLGHVASTGGLWSADRWYLAPAY